MMLLIMIFGVLVVCVFGVIGFGIVYISVFDSSVMLLIGRYYSCLLW